MTTPDPTGRNLAELRDALTGYVPATQLDTMVKHLASVVATRAEHHAALQVEVDWANHKALQVEQLTHELAAMQARLDLAAEDRGRTISTLAQAARTANPTSSSAWKLADQILQVLSSHQTLTYVDGELFSVKEPSHA